MNTNKPENKDVKPPFLRVRTDPETAKGVYANVANIRQNANEVLIDFILSDDVSNGHLVSRVILSKDHANKFLKVLNDVINSKKQDHDKE